MSVSTRKKVHPVFQIEAAECGAASLCMVLNSYGRFIDLTEMRRDCHVSRDGSRLSLMMKAAEKHGMKAEAFRRGPKLENTTFPCIVFWRGYHFLVVERVTDKWVFLVDPETGKRKITHEEFEQNYSGVLLELTPTESFERKGKPYNSVLATLKVLTHQRATLAYLCALTLLINIVGLAIPGFTRVFTDYYLPSIHNVNTGMYFLSFAMVLAIQYVMLLLNKRIVLRFQRLESSRITSSTIKKLLRLPVSYFQTRSHSVISRRLETIEQLAKSISEEFVPITLGLVFSIIYLFLLFYYHVLIGLFITLAIALILAVLFLLISISVSSSQTAANTQISFFASFSQSVRLFDTLKSTAMEDYAYSDTLRRYHGYQNALQTSQKTLSIVQAIPVVVPLLMQLVVISIGGYEAARGAMTIGEVLACINLSMSVFTPLAQCISVFSSLQSRQSDMKALDDIQNEDSDVIAVDARELSRHAVAPVTDGSLDASVEVRDVSFGYNTALPPILHDISFSVRPGQSLALVGGSGSGKSTILSLIEGYYLPQQGDVTIGGVPREALDRKSAAALMSIVTQRPEVFKGTIRDNISLFDSSISMEEVIEAARDACILDEIEAHEGGFEAQVMPGNTSLSGGQVQRIMIARALVRNPAILILDEATSALDTLVEEQIMRNVQKRGITRIIVAHRLSTIRDSDQILVLDQGRVVECGRHEQLMAIEDGIYQRLIRAGESQK